MDRQYQSILEELTIKDELLHYFDSKSNVPDDILSGEPSSIRTRV